MSGFQGVTEGPYFANESIDWVEVRNKARNAMTKDVEEDIVFIFRNAENEVSSSGSEPLGSL